MPFSPKQIEVLRFPYTDFDSLICDGSIRSGKSSVLVISFVLQAMNRFNNQQFAICGKTVQATERNIIKPLLGIKYMRQNFQMNYTSSTHTMTIKRGSKMNVFYIFGGNDESSFTLIQGFTSAGIFLDEVALMPRSFVEQAIARCSVPGSKHFFSCNPEGPTHWFYREWIKEPKDKKVMYLHFDMDDNPSLTDQIKQRYRAMYDGVFYDRYILGKWVKAEGIIYRRFADHPELFIRKQIPKDIVMINCGVDFGGTKSATTFVASAITRGFREWGVMETERHPEELSPELLDKAFAKFCTKVYEKYGRSFQTRCDNAEPVLIRGLKNAVISYRLHTDVLNAKKKPVNDRIDFTVRMMGEGRFFIMEWCKSGIDAYSNAVWSDKNPDERLDDGTSDIDTIDGTEYSVEEFIDDFLDVSPIVLASNNNSMNIQKAS